LCDNPSGGAPALLFQRPALVKTTRLMLAAERATAQPTPATGRT
jgi:hypothetical protein